MLNTIRAGQGKFDTLPIVGMQQKARRCVTRRLTLRDRLSQGGEHRCGVALRLNARCRVDVGQNLCLTVSLESFGHLGFQKGGETCVIEQPHPIGAGDMSKYLETLLDPGHTEIRDRFESTGRHHSGLRITRGLPQKCVFGARIARPGRRPTSS
jgi:hypothetical protein